VQYGTGFSIIVLLFLYWAYSAYFYVAPTCFDGRQNGEEAGVDCDGGCVRVCAFNAQAPIERWTRSFRVSDGQYNAVAYVENPNPAIGTPELRYTFSLYDQQGLITERSGTTFLPPNGAYPIFEGRINTGGRIPSQTFIDIESPEVWLPVTTGREQFSLVRRQLSRADTNPRLDATLVNNALTPTGEVEVVATIFDANGNALTASQTVVDDFIPRSEAQLTFTWPEPIAKTVRSCEVPTDVVIAIDVSGSMNNDQAEPPQPITDVTAAARQFAARLQQRDQAALVTFATDAIVAEPFATPQAIANRVAAIAIDPAEEQGSTNTGDAFVRADELFAGAAKNPDARKVMVILTDGLATAPEQEPEQYALAQAEALKATGVEVYAIGLGEQVNMEFVRAVASPDAAYQALSRNQIDSIYQTITGAICEDGAAVIDIVPKTNANFPLLR
jgi:Mg-chelatase subunit ChlD